MWRLIGSTYNLEDTFAGGIGVGCAPVVIRGTETRLCGIDIRGLRSASYAAKPGYLLGTRECDQNRERRNDKEWKPGFAEFTSGGCDPHRTPQSRATCGSISVSGTRLDHRMPGGDKLTRGLPQPAPGTVEMDEFLWVSCGHARRGGGLFGPALRTMRVACGCPGLVSIHARKAVGR